MLTWSYRLWIAKLFFPLTKLLNLERLGGGRKTWCYSGSLWPLRSLLNGGSAISLTCSLTSPPACCIRVAHSTTHSRSSSTSRDFYCIIFLSVSGLTVFIPGTFLLDPLELISRHCSTLSAPKLRNLLVSFQFPWSISLDSSPQCKPLNLVDLGGLDVLHSLQLHASSLSGRILQSWWLNGLFFLYFVCFASTSAISCLSSQYHINNQRRSRVVFRERKQQIPAVQAVSDRGRESSPVGSW